MTKIRVLIVDDAVVVRRMLSDVLSQDPDLEVAGVAPNGKIGLAKITQVNPDVVTLDLEMPEMDGLETLAALRKTHPLLPVIIFSTLTERGAQSTLDALALGANDYITKPANVGSVVIAIQRIREELIPKIKALCPRASTSKETSGGAQKGESPLPWPKKTRRAPTTSRRGGVDILTIAVSTGGPNALTDLMPKFPADFPVPIVIVQHMPPIFTRLLAERLDSKSSISVREASAGEPLRPGCAWIAPGDYHLAVRGRGGDVVLCTHQDPPENSCRPAADVLFRSVAEAYKDKTLAVVMTGMGKDGFRGCEHIHEAGGQILVQDEATSVVWGMPGFVSKAGLADWVLPLDKLAPEIIRRCQSAANGIDSRSAGFG